MPSIKPPYLTWQDTDGTPLDQGYIYIGTNASDPLVSPLQVFWDLARTIVAAQPIRTIGGYPMRNGAPANIYTAQSDYSILVQNRNGAQVYTASSLTHQTSLGEIDEAAIAAELLTGFYEKSVRLPVGNAAPPATNWSMTSTSWESTTNGAALDLPFPPLAPGSVITKIDIKVRKDAGAVTLGWYKRDLEIAAPANAPAITTLQLIFTAGHTSGAWTVKTWTGSYTTLAEDLHFLYALQGSADACYIGGAWITCQPMIPFEP